MKCESIAPYWQTPLLLLVASAASYSILFLLIAPSLTALVVPVSIFAVQTSLLVAFGGLALVMMRDAEPSTTLRLQEATAAFLTDDLDHITLYEPPR